MSLQPPLFILASPRSFTSLICAMLGQHPQLYGVPELDLFIEERMDELVKPMGGARQRNLNRHGGLLRAVAHLYSGEQTLLSLDLARRWLLNRLDRTTGEVYQELCRKVYPLRIVDKSPIYSMKSEHLHRLHRAFPEARYLHLVRHPRTQGQSVMKHAGAAIAIFSNSIDYSTSPPTVDPQYLWYKMQRNILAFLEEIPQDCQMRLHGEDILNNPSLYFEQVCHWLGLDWNESVLQEMLHPQNSPYACPGPYGANLGNDYNFLQSPRFEQRTVAASSLDGPLPWRRDRKGFLLPTLELARALGYE